MDRRPSASWPKLKRRITAPHSRSSNLASAAQRLTKDRCDRRRPVCGQEMSRTAVIYSNSTEGEWLQGQQSGAAERSSSRTPVTSRWIKDTRQQQEAFARRANKTEFCLLIFKCAELSIQGNSTSAKFGKRNSITFQFENKTFFFCLPSNSSPIVFSLN